VPSYSPVFSSQLILGTDATGFPSFEVPAGFTAVARDFSAWDIGGGAVVEMVVQNSGAAPGVVCAVLGPIGVASYEQWQGRVVIPAGGILSLTITAVFARPDVYVGGYLLRNTLT
jgi:hypothetical protein